MVEPSLLATFVVTSPLLMVLPGPNVALIVANSVGLGTRAGLLTVVGTSSAGALLLMLAGAGLTAMLTAVATWVEWIRWLGVIYLLYLGVAQWRAEALDLLQRPAISRSVAWLFGRGAMMSLTSPKTLVFYAASSRNSSTPRGGSVRNWPVGRHMVGPRGRERHDMGIARRTLTAVPRHDGPAPQPCLRRLDDGRRRRSRAVAPHVRDLSRRKLSNRTGP